jgi:hypothetical protein
MSEDMWGLLRLCWNPEPSQRPTMLYVVAQLQEIAARNVQQRL